MTMLLIEHHMDLVVRVSDRVTVLDYGAVIAEGPPAAVQRDPAWSRPISGLPMPLLEVDDLHVAYGDLEVVKGISLQRSSQGEIVTVLGSNGAGKTTTLRSLAGLLRAGRGRQHCLDGKAISGIAAARDRRSRARAGAGGPPALS